MYEYKSTQWPEDKGSIVGPLVPRAEIGPMKTDAGWLTQNPDDETDVQACLSIRYRSSIASHIDVNAIIGIMIHGKVYALVGHMFNIGDKLSFLIQITNNAPNLRSTTYWHAKQAREAARQTLSSGTSTDGGSRERVQVTSPVPSINPAQFPNYSSGDEFPNQVVEIGSRRQVMRLPLK